METMQWRGDIGCKNQTDNRKHESIQAYLLFNALLLTNSDYFLSRNALVVWRLLVTRITMTSVSFNFSFQNTEWT